MAKKICGILLILLAAITVYGGTLPGNQINVLSWIAIVLFVSSGILLILYDGGANTHPHTLYKRRKVLNKLLVFLLVISIILLIVAAFGVGFLFALMDEPVMILIMVFSLVLYAFPAVVLGITFGSNVLPYSACRKHIPGYETLVDKTLVCDKDLVPCSADRSVMANDKVLYFPRQCCLIPFEMIESCKYANPLKIEPDVFFKLVNGKTILIVNKNFDDIRAAIDARKSNP